MLSLVSSALLFHVRCLLTLGSGVKSEVVAEAKTTSKAKKRPSKKAAEAEIKGSPMVYGALTEGQVWCWCCMFYGLLMLCECSSMCRMRVLCYQQWVVAQYGDALRTYIGKKHSGLNTKFFADFIQRYPVLGNTRSHY